MSAEHYHDIGSYLKDCREGLGYKIADASKQLNIRERYLKAIEKGDFEVLPGTIYTEGYLKNYAEYLQLDPKEVLNKYRQGGSANDDKEELDFPLPEPTGDKLIPSPAVLIGAGVAMVALYVLWYAYQNFDGTILANTDEEEVQQTETLSEGELTTIGVMSGRIGIDDVKDKNLLEGLDTDSSYSLPGISEKTHEEVPVIEKPKKKAPADKVSDDEVLGWKTKEPE